ncbi:MAG: Maf family protein [Patescibacteria group bacterium]|nr:Maf family protein [Patescibacteria group bacterium]
MKPTKPVILASTSPRRRELLAATGLMFTAVASPYKEVMPQSADPEELVIRFSREKARAVRDAFRNSIIIGADTVVALGNRVFGKPENPEDATDMLYSLQGRTHAVYTGITVLDTTDGKERSDVSRTNVTFAPLTREQIRAYHRKVSPFDKAGSYAIQEHAAAFTERIDGEFYTIVGLPVCRLREVLENFGIFLM